jgi:hypothetical protein
LGGSGVVGIARSWRSFWYVFRCASVIIDSDVSNDIATFSKKSQKISIHAPPPPNPWQWQSGSGTVRTASSARSRRYRLHRATATLRRATSSQTHGCQPLPKNKAQIACMPPTLLTPERVAVAKWQWYHSNRQLSAVTPVPTAPRHCHPPPSHSHLNTRTLGLDIGDGLGRRVLFAVLSLLWRGGSGWVAVKVAVDGWQFDSGSGSGRVAVAVGWWQGGSGSVSDRSGNSTVTVGQFGSGIGVVCGSV